MLTNSLLAASITGTNASATSSGANAAVAGYMAFLLYSVALLACESLSLFSFADGLTVFIFCFISVVRFCGSTAYMIIRMFAGE